MKSKDTYLFPTISDLNLEDVNSWWDIEIDGTEKSKKKKKRKKKKKAAKKKKKAAKKRKKAAKKLKKKKIQKMLKKQKKLAEKQYTQEFKYQLLIKATDTACDITKMYFYSKFGSPA